ncbi:mannosyltransferase [Tricholoma matsutake]|nr:mannosyltransferase [Tricholoma matsutake 945]
MSTPLRIAFIHPDLGIGGAERLVVDAALGLQTRGHCIDIYTSHHDPNHCFDETRDGTLRVHHIVPPFPRSLNGKFHIFLAHARQLHLTSHLLCSKAPTYDVYFVDQLSTCIPFLRIFGKTRVVFYGHFPDKLLAYGAFVEGRVMKRQGSLLKGIYRYPMDWLEEITTRQSDIIFANSKFTARVFKTYFSSIRQPLRVVYPGINISAYESDVDANDPDIIAITSDRLTFVSLNRFERKKNAALAIQSFADLRVKITTRPEYEDMRLILAGGYDPRLEDNLLTLYSLIDLAKSLSLTYNVITPASTQKPVKIPPLNMTRKKPDVLFLLNFNTFQRTAMLRSPFTIALLYTPENEHFGVVPVEAMACGVPVLACNSGGPMESVLDDPPEIRTGWLRSPDREAWAGALYEIVSMSDRERDSLSKRARERARALFGMEAMAHGLEDSLLEAVGMGRVEYRVNMWWAMLFGFLIAYAAGPWLLPG